MTLTGPQIERFTRALTQAFPKKSTLEQMVKTKLDRNLDEIAVGSDIKVINYRMVTKANAEGWVETLLIGAREANPGNPELLAFAQELGLASGTLAQVLSPIIEKLPSARKEIAHALREINDLSLTLINEITEVTRADRSRSGSTSGLLVSLHGECKDAIDNLSRLESDLNLDPHLSKKPRPQPNVEDELVDWLIREYRIQEDAGQGGQWDIRYKLNLTYSIVEDEERTAQRRNRIVAADTLLRETCYQIRVLIVSFELQNRSRAVDEFGEAETDARFTDCIGRLDDFMMEYHGRFHSKRGKSKFTVYIPLAEQPNTTLLYKVFEAAVKVANASKSIYGRLDKSSDSSQESGVKIAVGLGRTYILLGEVMFDRSGEGPNSPEKMLNSMSAYQLCISPDIKSILDEAGIEGDSLRGYEVSRVEGDLEMYAITSVQSKA